METIEYLHRGIPHMYIKYISKRSPNDEFEKLTRFYYTIGNNNPILVVDAFHYREGEYIAVAEALKRGWIIGERIGCYPWQFGKITKEFN